MALFGFMLYGNGTHNYGTRKELNLAGSVLFAAVPGICKLVQI